MHPCPGDPKAAVGRICAIPLPATILSAIEATPRREPPGGIGPTVRTFEPRLFPACLALPRLLRIGQENILQPYLERVGVRSVGILSVLSAPPPAWCRSRIRILLPTAATAHARSAIHAGLRSHTERSETGRPCKRRPKLLAPHCAPSKLAKSIKRHHTLTQCLKGSAVYAWGACGNSFAFTAPERNQENSDQ
jgi:hypothetical protein